MKKEIKNFGKIIEISLVVLTFISLIINAIYMTNHIYSLESELIALNMEPINNFCNSSIFNVILWVDNILIYFLLIFYIIDTIQNKKNMFLRISFSLFSVLTTMIVFVGEVNIVSNIFGIFN